MKNIAVKVKKDFLDRRTGIKHKAGETLTVTAERLREIKRSGDFVEIVKATEPKKEN